MRMLKITRMADYATTLLHTLSLTPEESMSATVLAEKTHLSIHMVSKILKTLHRAALVESSQGAQGGYRLARDPADISLGELIVAIDGELAMIDCAQSDSVCAQQSTCSLQSNWRYVNQLIRDLLDGISLEVMSAPHALQAEFPLHFQTKESHHGD